MKKIVAISLAILMVVLGIGTAVTAAGDQIPSASAAFAMNGMVTMTIDKQNSDTGWLPVLTTQVKTGTPKDLVIDVSAETFLGTSAKLSGEQGSSATAGVEVRVLVDGVEAAPGPVIFDNRMLKLDGDLTHHISGTVLDFGTLEIEDHWIEVFIDTAAAHAFNFAIENVGAGVHDVVVEARLTATGDGLKGEANAAIGKASAVVNEVMFKYVSNQ